MAGSANFPTALDDDTSLHDVQDGVNTIQAAHHNNLKEAVKAIEEKVGILNTAAPTALDARLGHPTIGHTHDGASGQGPQIDTSGLSAGPSAVGGDSSLLEHVENNDYHKRGFHFVKTFRAGSVASGANQFIPMDIMGWGEPSTPDYLRLIEVSAVARRGPSGATTVIDVNFNGISIWTGINAQRLMIANGGSYAYRATFAIATYIVGAIITVDADAVGSSTPGEDISINFTFRE